VAFDFEKMYELIRGEPEFKVVSFSSEIFEVVVRTKMAEIHDRIIVATAGFYRAGILTKDNVIRESKTFER
jgi:hypothetical protein